jgi:glycosyltransferase involved in cell wall biosynthesis
MPDRFTTSIVICFYKRLDLLKCCLDSLVLNSGHFEEVVIADDGSAEDVTDNLRRMIPSYPFPIVHAWHPRDGARRAATRNNGIRHANGDYLVFVDADFALLQGSIKAHIDAAKPWQFAAGRVKYTTREQGERIIKEGVSARLLQEMYTDLPEKPISREHCEFIRHSFLRKLGLAHARKQTFGGHFSAFKKDLEAVNGYDEMYMGWGGEDQDMAHRLVLSGMSGRSVIREARVLHVWHERDAGEKDWKESSNTKYFLRDKVSARCENGLKKPGI